MAAHGRERQRKTVNVTLLESMRPLLSVTYRTAALLPAVAKVFVKIGWVEIVVPFVCAHRNATMFPSGSCEPLPSKVQVLPATHVTTGTETGAVFGGGGVVLGIT